MPEQIYIGNVSKGQITSREPFVIDNDAFPTLFNMYVWRGRIKRKRGTTTLGQMQIQTTIPSGTDLSSGTINLITVLSLPSTSTISPGTISFTVGANTYTEPTPPNGTLVGAPAGTGTINYATGAVTITGGGSSAITGTFSYFPGNVSMGQRDFVPSIQSFYPLMISFDTTNAYQVNQTMTPFFYNITFYKGTNIPFSWSGTDYQQFWTTNYQGAFWTTNSKSGLNFLSGTYSSGSGSTTITFNFKNGVSNFTTLVVGDILWFNEWAAGGVTLNGISGTVSNISGAASGNYVVTFLTSQTVSSTGIVQMLTNTLPGQDGIKWYDGDPTGGTGYPTGSGLGWVNFAPPLTAATVSLEGSSAQTWYLIGALMIIPFKDRLLFLNPTIGTSSGSTLMLQDVVIWSWNGTPYYSLPVPVNQTANVKAYYVDQSGAGGYLSAGIDQPIVTASTNEDVLIIGFGGGRGRKTRFVYSGNDLNPFLFFSINSELPSTATFSSITLDRGAIDIGTYGISMTDQQSTTRIDLDIPDSVFEISNLNNGYQRVNSARDFQKEWIYFSYPPATSAWNYPTQTFLFNYRDNTWAILYENYTSRGTFRYSQGFTWATLPYNNWSEWVDPWNSAIAEGLFPIMVGGTPQGYVQTIGEGTSESPSCTIYAIATANGGTATQITSYNHCLTSNNINTEYGDYIYITGMLGATGLNGLIGQVIKVIDDDNFVIDLPFPSGSYLGLGVFSKLSQPLVQTKQFNPYWEQGRQVRLCVQKYLLDATSNAQVTVNIYLSQDSTTVFNAGPFYPNPNSFNNTLVYSQLMYTCPESTNLGLTPANVNLQMPTAATQSQIWHRFNTSLIGDSVQVGITLNDTQMRDLNYATSEITLHGLHLVVDRGPQLA